MKNLAIIFSILLTGFSAAASSVEKTDTGRRGYDGNAFIFVEGDVEFSVFPDGQFDFIYVGPQKGNSISISSPNMNITFNTGYNYDAYVQYDAYGAVIQVENVPVYYDEFGRIIRAGNVDIRYNNRRLVRVGGLHIIYNNYGHFMHCTGAINVFNPYYVYRPWHVYYARPLYTHVIVYDYPYRRYYSPVRYSYHDHVVFYKNRKNYQNGRRNFYRPGSKVHYRDGRVADNRNYDPNRRNTMIADGGRNNRSVSANNGRNNENIRASASHADGNGRRSLGNNRATPNSRSSEAAKQPNRERTYTSRTQRATEATGRGESRSVVTESRTHQPRANNKVGTQRNQRNSSATVQSSRRTTSSSNAGAAPRQSKKVERKSSRSNTVQKARTNSNRSSTNTNQGQNTNSRPASRGRI